ncbi:MAG: hypothetical protein AB2385_07200 [Symbiobacterium sp.]|uniref:hypothetical protein n=1 Tax=Symbiobacterium sp. TaxID=1971213 RepID=UPI00346447F9
MSGHRPSHPEGGPGLPNVPELLRQLDEAVRTLDRLAAALEAMVARPPVQMQVEHLDVGTLAFHLGDIDVQELAGELNIGITHSLRLAPPTPRNGGGGGGEGREGTSAAQAAPTSGGRASGEEGQSRRQSRKEAPAAHRERQGGKAVPAQGGSSRAKALGTPGAEGGVKPAPPPGGSAVRALPNSVVSRRRALARPDPAAAEAKSPPPGPAHNPPPHDSTRCVQVWPPPRAEGSERDDNHARGTTP